MKYLYIKLSWYSISSLWSWQEKNSNSQKSLFTYICLHASLLHLGPRWYNGKLKCTEVAHGHSKIRLFHALFVLKISQERKILHQDPSYYKWQISARRVTGLSCSGGYFANYIVSSVTSSFSKFLPSCSPKQKQFITKEGLQYQEEEFHRCHLPSISVDCSNYYR